jgi:hypothetical protein
MKNKSDHLLRPTLFSDWRQLPRARCADFMPPACSRPPRASRSLFLFSGDAKQRPDLHFFNPPLIFLLILQPILLFSFSLFNPPPRFSFHFSSFYFLPFICHLLTFFSFIIINYKYGYFFHVC